jgi:hypothetical protein
MNYFIKKKKKNNLTNLILYTLIIINENLKATQICVSL